MQSKTRITFIELNHDRPRIRRSFFSGYVLSKAALRLFITKGTQKPGVRECAFVKGAEDVNMGKCLGVVGVAAVDSRDSLGRHRFFPMQGSFFTEARNYTNTKYWIWKYNYYPQSVVREWRAGIGSKISFLLSF